MASLEVGSREIDGFVVKAVAVRRDDPPGGFDATVQVFDTAGRMTDSRFFRVINMPFSTLEEARDEALRHLERVERVDADGIFR